MTYSVEIRPAAARALKRISEPHASRIDGAIQLLALDPRPPAAKPLRGRPEWRLRIGDYRVLYSIENNRLLIIVLTVAHRREVYER